MAGERSELAEALVSFRPAIATVVALSFVLNILVLGGSLYLMMVYDSVLPSHSIPTLAGLFAMVCLIYLFQGLIELSRARILAMVGEGLGRRLGDRVHQAMADLALRSGRLAGDGLTPMRDLDQIRSFMTGGGPAALIDLPWVIFFLGFLALLHVLLGITALAGALILTVLTIVTDRIGRDPTQRLSRVVAERVQAASTNVRHIELLTSLGMRKTMHDRWTTTDREYLDAQDTLSSTASRLSTVSKLFRMILQSTILTVGAFLVVRGQASGGVIFAASLLSGRALAPVDMAIANWRGFSAARDGWRRIDQLLATIAPTPVPEIALCLPSQKLVVDGLALAPPGHPQPTLHSVHFQLPAGSALGIIGPSGSGKTSLGRTLLGLWPPMRGRVMLDGATLDQWDSQRLGQAIGYLPQSVELFEGTIAQNIARFSPAMDTAAIVTAAKDAGVHEMIVDMPQGYGAQVGREGSLLSAGQRQRIGLARALYGSPFLVVLDEPNSNMDNVGELALHQSIADVRVRGGIVIVITHRPSLLSGISHLLFLREGKMEAFGERDDIISRLARAGDEKDRRFVKKSILEDAA